MLLTHQESQAVMAQLKTGATRAGASGRDAVFRKDPGEVPVGAVIVLAIRYGLGFAELFSTAAAASAKTSAGLSSRALASPKN